MAIDVTITGSEEVHALLQALPPQAFEVAKKAVGKAVLDTHTQVSAYRGGIKNRSGRLRRSLKTSLTGTTLENLNGTVFTDMIYAPIQETGGTIQAKRAYLGVPGGPYLNIPLPDNKTRAGVMRQNAQQVFANGGYIIKSKLGNYLVVSGQGQLMFTLKKKVTIPARLEMLKSGQDQIPTLLSTLNNELLKGL